ncbi:L,D-transpeptidase [Jannaschia sp. LMIT008]|uniref:L,D-transpeptidase n=1 Tax=Jannaschia maritima TaxID=3032585 RepID=UPI0028115635|nr:L,D-transpeptidase [Jannaschia sp. LMIT008]
MNRRAFLSAASAAALATPALGYTVPVHLRPTRIAVRDAYAPGTVVVIPQTHFLYWMEEGGTAMRYGVGVGRAGLEFQGVADVARKAEWPSWTPTPDMIARNPERYAQYAGGVPGGPDNPLGSRALYLYQDGVDTYYRIHGTTSPRSIGRSVSNGCIRMVNAHIEDLYERVPIGTPVHVL